VVEARPGARGRQHRRSEAGGADASDRARARATGAGGGHSGRSAERGRRRRAHGRRAAGAAPRRGEDRLHRFHRRRQAHRRSRAGDPLDDRTEMGPLISADQRSKVSTYVEDGAKVAIRGSAPTGPGFWFPPTVLSPVAPGDRAAREEIFGPVAAVIPFSDEAEA